MSEVDGEPQARRSIAAASNLNRGTIVTESDIIWLRPGTGILPGQEKLILGRKLVRALKKGELIQLEDVSK